MTFKHIEKEFDEQFPAMDNYLDGGVKKDIKSFLKQSFIKYLQSEVERLDGTKQGEIIYIECPHAFDCGGCMDKTDKDAVAYNQSISDQITYLQAQIKELEA